MPDSLPPEDEIARLRAENERLRSVLEPFAAGGGQWGAWLAWLVGGAPDRERGKAAAKQIVHWRAAVDEALFRKVGETAVKADTAAPASWPFGCIKPSSCARHRQCMYAQSGQQCRHFGKNLSAEIEEAARAHPPHTHPNPKREDR